MITENCIDPFLAVIEDIFKKEIYLPLEIKDPLLKRNKRTTHEVSNIIGLSGDITGCISISMTENLAIKIASAIAGYNFLNFNGDCVNGIKDFVKIIIEDAESLFVRKNISISYKKLIIGDLKIDYPADLSMIVMIPCTVMEDLFSIDFGVKET